MQLLDEIAGGEIRDANVRAAVSSLVRVSSWGNAYLVTTSLVYPSGSIVGVKVTPSKGGYWVSDFAMGFREAEMMEAQRSFGSHAGRLKEQLGVEYTDNHEIRIFARENQIAWAIRRVSYASHRAMVKAYKALPDWDEQEIGAGLYQRLRDLFGDDHVKPDVHVVGASNLDWKFAAGVQMGKRRVLFAAVTPHYSSVCSAVSKFTDVRRLGAENHPVAVVDKLEKMGKWLPLITQQVEVIEESASEDMLRNVVKDAA